jgi:hypothetical protein
MLGATNPGRETLAPPLHSPMRHTELGPVFVLRGVAIPGKHMAMGAYVCVRRGGMAEAINL